MASCTVLCVTGGAVTELYCSGSYTVRRRPMNGNYWRLKLQQWRHVRHSFGDNPVLGFF